MSNRAPDPRTWTIAYRRRTANRFVRVTNWAGNWHQAYNLASAFGELHPELQVHYVPTAEYDAEEAREIAAGTLSAAYAEDHGNVLVDSGKRVRIVDTGQLDEALSAVGYCGACCNGDQGDSLTGRIPCTECDGNGRIAAPSTEPATAAGPAGYRVTFDRIGRNHGVEPLTATAGDADELAEAVYRYARPHLASRDVEVVVDLAAGSGFIFCGFNNGGTFTIETAEVAA